MRHVNSYVFIRENEYEKSVAVAVSRLDRQSVSNITKIGCNRRMQRDTISS